MDQVTDEWSEALSSYRTDRQSCLDKFDTLDSREICLCSINYKFQIWVCDDQLEFGKRKLNSSGNLNTVDEYRDVVNFYNLYNRACVYLTQMSSTTSSITTTEPFTTGYLYNTLFFFYN